MSYRIRIGVEQTTESGGIRVWDGRGFFSLRENPA